MTTQGALKTFHDIELVGGKVRLRPVRATDGEAVFHFFSDDRVTHNLPFEGPVCHEDELEWARKAAALPNVAPNARWAYPLAIEQIGQPGLIGVVTLHMGVHEQQWEVGYWLGPWHWGNGYATDALRLATHFAFTHLDALRVYATVFTRNGASRRVLEKNGFNLDATRRAQVLKAGDYLDEWYCTLLRPEWESRKEWYQPKSEHIVVLA
ncbi:MAG: N-acetyltransferase [Dehalococcoidia bacterium]|nr:N-acetyltransferase [Dehalococcoidia bacterium]